MSSYVDGAPDGQARGTSSSVPLAGTGLLQWDYDRVSEPLVRIYEQAKARQWDVHKALDWSAEPDPDNPLGMPEDFVPIAGSPLWASMPPSQRGIVRRHLSAWLYSQFLHSEQFALVGVGKLSAGLDDMSAKFVAATQLVDEARHVEGFHRLLGLMGPRYRLVPALEGLFADVIREQRWDFGVIAAHLLVENFGLATLGQHVKRLGNPLALQFSQYVLADEARHVAFGRIVLKGFYAQLSEGELREREEFVLEGCQALKERYNDDAVWEVLGLGQAARALSRRSPAKREFRRLAFMRIVPGIRAVGLLSRRVEHGLDRLGLLGFLRAGDPDDGALCPEAGLAGDAELSWEEIARERMAAVGTGLDGHPLPEVI